jgi:hypothetical protein
LTFGDELFHPYVFVENDTLGVRAHSMHVLEPPKRIGSLVIMF